MKDAEGNLDFIGDSVGNLLALHKGLTCDTSWFGPNVGMWYGESVEEPVFLLKCCPFPWYLL